LKKIVMATGNQGKLKEMQSILTPFALAVVSQKSLFEEEAVEDGLSFLENALIKARFASLKTGLPAIADDSGLEVPYLNGAPGIYSSRYAGENATDRLNNEKLLAQMSGVSGKDRKACYYCAMVYVSHAEDPVPQVGLGQWCGEVLEAPLGDGGFGYDPIIWIPSHQCSAAQLEKEAKNQISHRAQALNQLISGNRIIGA